MKLLLFHGKGLISAAIRAQTRSQYSHAAIQLRDDSPVIIEAWQGKGVQQTKVTDWEGITSFDIDVSHNPKAVETFLRMQLGKRYDYKSVARFVTRRKADNDDSWFCSELVFAALQYAGVKLLRANASEVSPGMLALSPLISPT